MNTNTRQGGKGVRPDRSDDHRLRTKRSDGRQRVREQNKYNEKSEGEEGGMKTTEDR